MSAPEAGTDPDHRIYLDRPVIPNQSLSRRGMWTVLAVLAVFNLMTAVFLFVVGAYPAPIFLGVDMLAVSVAFWVIDRRRGRMTERICVTSHRVEVLRPSGGQPGAVWTSPPGFTRVVIDKGDEDLPSVNLTSAGRSVAVGETLGAEGRIALAAEIEQAITAARNERYSS